MSESDMAKELAPHLFRAAHYREGMWACAAKWTAMSDDEKREFVHDAIAYIKARRPNNLRIVTGLGGKLAGGINLPEAS